MNKANIGVIPVNTTQFDEALREEKRTAQKERIKALQQLAERDALQHTPQIGEEAHALLAEHNERKQA